MKGSFIFVFQMVSCRCNGISCVYIHGLSLCSLGNKEYNKLFIWSAEHETIKRDISLLSIGLLVQSSLSKCSGYDLLRVFSSSKYGSLICVFISVISLLFENKSILNTSATGFSMVCIYSA